MGNGQEVQGVEPHPLPTTVGIAVVEFMRETEDTDGLRKTEVAKMVRLTLGTPAGVAVVFFQGAEAEGVGKVLMEQGRLAELGIEVVRGNGRAGLRLGQSEG